MVNFLSFPRRLYSFAGEEITNVDTLNKDPPPNPPPKNPQTKQTKTNQPTKQTNEQTNKQTNKQTSKKQNKSKNNFEALGGTKLLNFSLI